MLKNIVSTAQCIAMHSLVMSRVFMYLPCNAIIYNNGNDLQWSNLCS